MSDAAKNLINSRAIVVPEPLVLIENAPYCGIGPGGFLAGNTCAQSGDAGVAVVVPPTKDAMNRGAGGVADYLQDAMAGPCGRSTGKFARLRCVAEMGAARDGAVM